MPEPKKHQDRQYKQNRPKKADSQLMAEEGEKRSGSDSDAHSGRKRDRLHENHKDQNQPQPFQPDVDFSHDLNPNNRAGENHGMDNPDPTKFARSAYDIKDLYDTLADLTDDELKSIQIVPVGTHLEQGAKYLDLAHLEQDEFAALSNMVAEPGHYYVPKKETDYVLWNRLNQVATPERLDETESENA